MKSKTNLKTASVKSAAKKTAKKVIKAARKAGDKLAAHSRKAAPTKVVKALATAASKAKKPTVAPKGLSKSSMHSSAVRLGTRLNQVVSSARKTIRSVEQAAKPVAGLVNSLTEAQVRRMSPSDYMNEVQLDFFRRRLFQMREEVLAREVDVKERLHQREVFADPADRASAEEEHWLDLRLRERESLLLRKIDDALRRIKDKEYGYCEVTGEPIGIPRLLARPTATVCVDVKGHNEQIESQFRDR
jgi:DnaK suppressor protein